MLSFSGLFVAITAALPQQAPPPDSVAAVDKVFSWTSAISPGCAVAVSRGGKTIISRAYGMANLEYDVRNTPGTIFEAGSVSKQFTAAAVALLAHDGKLSLEDPIRKYFPEIPDYGAPVTIRQMLNHTSGLRDWGTVASAGGWPRGTRMHTHKHVLDIISRQKSLNFTPGSEYLYSNSNYNLAAMLVERVSGMSFAEFTRARIFQPLGMTNTSWRDDYTRIVKNRATAYTAAGGGAYRQDMPFENVHGNGGLLTTVEDLLKWNENFVNPTVGGVRLAADLETRGRLSNGREITYALGLMIGNHRGVPEVVHTGSTAGYRAFLARYPQQKLGVALLCNQGTVSPAGIGHRVAEIFLEGQFAPATTQASSSTRLGTEQLFARAGLFRNESTGEAIRFVARDSTLSLERGGRLMPASENVFLSGSGGRVEFTDDGRRFRLISRDADTTRFVREAEWTPSISDLGQYAGNYWSDEAESSFTILAQDGKLIGRDRHGRDDLLTPAYRDAFTSPTGTLIVFRRDRTGAVDAASLGLGRVRELRFLKKP